MGAGAHPRRVAFTPRTGSDTRCPKCCSSGLGALLSAGPYDLAGEGAARRMCSEHVHLKVSRRCGSIVLGLWDCGGALLRSVEEQLRLHFKSTVRRAAPCTMSCCPPWHAYSPGAGTHHCTLARTLGLSGCVHSRAHIWDRLVLLVFRAQVGSEATGPILLADNAISVRKIRPGADCFAALDVLPVAPLREHLQSGGHY